MGLRISTYIVHNGNFFFKEFLFPFKGRGANLAFYWKGYKLLSLKDFQITFLEPKVQTMLRTASH